MSLLAENITSLPVMESFYTLQGEGYHKGRAAYFIRLGGCDVGCVWCDVKESWDADIHPKFSVEEIIEKLLIEIDENQKLETKNEKRETRNKKRKTINEKRKTRNEKPLIVITGGEPLLHNLDELTKQLQSLGFETNIETSGSSPFSGYWNWVCLSPKKFKAPLNEILPLANELKIVVFNKSDFEWAEQYAALVHPSCKLYLQPEWDKSPTVTPLIIDYIKAHPQWQLSLQIHKYINVP